MSRLLKGEDAKRVTKPICFYPTKDEDRAEVRCLRILK
jgi:hypothetical protein